MNNRRGDQDQDSQGATIQNNEIKTFEVLPLISFGVVMRCVVFFVTPEPTSPPCFFSFVQTSGCSVHREERERQTETDREVESTGSDS